MPKFFLILTIVVLIFSTTYGQSTIVVAGDGTGQYSSLQQAFDAIAYNNKTPITIFVKKGIYREKLMLDSTKDYVTLIGEHRDSTIIIFNDHSGKIDPNGDTINTFTSETFLIRASDFKAENLTFQNDAGYSAGQAVSLHVHGDKIVFINCRILGFQDTIFTGGVLSRQYYSNCYIEGTTDFIFGPATALFENCHIHSKRNSHITAASTPQNVSYGYVFRNCRFTADDSIRKVTLGRPWRPYASVSYINSYLGAHIAPEGWDNWRNSENEKTARYAEYRNTGPGADTSGRVKWSKQLSSAEIRRMKVKTILRGWNPTKNR